jgi:hypothetical protein
MKGKRFPGPAAVSRGCCRSGPSGFDKHFWLRETLEDFAIEQFITKRPVEAFVVAILIGQRLSDVERLHADVRQPFWDCCRYKFVAIVGPGIRRRLARDEQVGEDRQHVTVFELPRHDQGEAFAARFIDDRQDPQLAATMGATLDEVACPDWRDLACQTFETRPLWAQVAQLVELRTKNSRVGGSNLPLGTIISMG